MSAPAGLAGGTCIACLAGASRTCFWLLFAWSVAAGVHGQSAPEGPPAAQRVPRGTLIVKGAWAGASDELTPVPEGGRVGGNLLSDDYFGMTWQLPPDWTQKFQGPPPSDTGRYVLAQLRPADSYHGPSRGNILITAQDLFFSSPPATSALQLTAYEKDHLPSSDRLERAPTTIRIAGRPFAFFAYDSPATQIHWYVLATQIRCHVLEFVLSSRDPKLLESVMSGMNTMRLPTEADPRGGPGGAGVPICIKDYAAGANVLVRVDPVLTEHRFTAVPVRIIIDTSGKVRHWHFLSAFPDQENIIAAALRQWRLKPYRRNGRPVEVETGIMFGRTPPSPARISPMRARARESRASPP